MSINKAEVSGNVIRDATIKPVGDASVMNFQVAVGGSRYDSETRTDQATTTFVSVEVWLAGDYTAADVVYVGDSVYVVGELTQYTPPGEKRSHTRIRALQVVFVHRGRIALDEIAGERRPAGAPRDGAPF